MTTPVLLVSTGTRWVGTARFPGALARAGFEVALLGPRGSLAEKSRHVHKIGHLPDQANAAQWVFAFAAMVKAVAPAIVLPCDDMAFRLLATLHTDPPAGMQPALHAELARLIADSLGDPGYYLTSVDKLLLPPAAAALGVRVPAFTTVGSAAEAEPFVAEHGWPLIVKRSFSTAGSGVAICDDRRALDAACAEFLAPAPGDPAVTRAPRLLLQAAIDGARMYHVTLAWRGEVRVGWTAEVLVAHTPPMGTAAVSRQFHFPAMREEVARLARGFGMHGIFGCEFMVEKGTGLPWLLEINRRVSPGFHRGAAFNVDLAAGLLAALENRPSVSRARLDDGEEHSAVNFPQEWLRDPGSRYLRERPVDVPWDDPDLIEAFLAMRHDR